MQDDGTVEKVETTMPISQETLEDSEALSATMSEKIREQIQKDQELAEKLKPVMDAEATQKTRKSVQGLTTALVPDAAMVKRKRNARSVKRVAKSRAKRKASRRRR